MEFLLQVELTIEPGQSLGLMIRGGLEYNLGIFVTGVDKDSVAERSGIQVKLFYLPTYYFLFRFFSRWNKSIRKYYSYYREIHTELRRY